MSKEVPIKYLVFAVDGTAATGKHWKTIFSDYLEKIIRNLSRKAEQNREAMFWLGLVVYTNRDPERAGCSVRVNLWTKNVNHFLKKLSHLTFSGGDGLNNAGIADGLSEALVYLPKPRVGSPEMFVAQYLAAEKHCVLVAASNPFVLPARLESPVVKNGRIRDLQTEFRTAAVDDVAKMFAECSISLSVISPKHLPSLKQIFNLGNGITDHDEVPSANNEEYYNPHDYLVLLSEKFPDIHSAFKEEQIMMMRSPSPASVEAQANFMETKPRSGNHITDEDMEITEPMLDDPTTHMQEDHIYPEETFNVMVPLSSNDLDRALASTEFNDSVASPFDEDRYEAILADFTGATESRHNQEFQTLPTIGGGETSAHENFMISTPAQTLEPERLMFMPMEMDANTLPPLMITKTLPNRPQVFYNFMPGELEMVCQTRGQITIDSVIVSSTSSIDSDISTSPPIGLQTAYIGQVGFHVPGVEVQPFPGSLTGYETPGLAANLADTQAADSSLFGILSGPQAIASADPSFAGILSASQVKNPDLAENLMVTQAFVSGLDGNLSVPHAVNPDFSGNLNVPHAAKEGLAENLMIPRAANLGFARNLTVPHAANDNLTRNSMIPQATNPGFARNLIVPHAANDSLTKGLMIPQAANADFAGNLTITRVTNFGLVENLMVSHAANNGLAENLMSPQPANPGFAGNFTVPHAANDSLTENLMVSQAANPDFVGNLMVPQSGNHGLAANLTVFQAATPDLAGNFMDPRAADSGLVGILKGPLAAASAETGLEANLMVPQETTSGLIGILSFSQEASSGFSNVPCPLSIDGEFQPKTLAEIFGEEDGFDGNQIGVGSNTEGEGGQLFITTIASEIERHLAAHGGMDDIVFADLESEQNRYLLSWQGNINAEHRGRIHSPGEAKAYRKSCAPDSLTADWPQTIPVGQILRQQDVFGIPYIGEVDIMVFAVMPNHGLNEKLKNEELCLKIDLPSQTMFFLPTERADRFFGALICEGSVQQPESLLVPKQELDIYDSVRSGISTVLCVVRKLKSQKGHTISRNEPSY